MKKKYIRYLSVFVFSIAFSISTAFAADSSIMCDYKIDSIIPGGKKMTFSLKYNYNVTKDTFKESVKITSKISDKDIWELNTKVPSGLKRKDLVTSKNTLKCPTIYTLTGTTMTGYPLINVSTKKEPNYKKATLKDSKINNSKVNTMTCRWNTEKEILWVTVDNSTKKITDKLIKSNDFIFDITDKQVMMTNYKYSDLVTKDINGKIVCNNKVKINIMCLIKGENASHCEVTKTSGAHRDEADADEGNSGWAGEYYKPIDGSQFVCNKTISDNLLQEIIKIYRTITLLIVVGVVIFGMLDFFKAISAGDDKTFKSVGKRFMNRLIIAVILVMLPTILELILTLFGDENMKNCLNKIT